MRHLTSARSGHHGNDLLKHLWILVVAWMGLGDLDTALVLGDVYLDATRFPWPATNAAPPDVMTLRRFEWIPAFAPPKVVSAQFPRDNPVFSVEHLLMADTHLWAALRPRAATNLSAKHGRLWSYTDTRGLLEPVRGPLEAHNVNALAVHKRSLWMALNGGLAALDSETRQVTPFGPSQGLTSTDLAGVGVIDQTVLALGRYGMLWGLPPGASNFVRASGSAPSENPRSPTPWLAFTTSGEWMAAISSNSVVVRHYRGQQWLTMQAELSHGSSRLGSPILSCITGDGEGGFWIGSDAGLHWINPESSVVENRFAPASVSISGGLGMRVAPGFQPSAAAYEMARQRVMGQIRDRMRERARYARASVGLKEPINPTLPTSRMPGGVTSLFHEGNWLWVACSDGLQHQRQRILLMHQPSRRWVGWFSVGAPVRTMAADARRLWLGLDVSLAHKLSPLLAVDRFPLISVPQTRWVKDAISEEELGNKLGSLPAKERAVMAFMGGDPKKVVELLAPSGEPTEDTDAESLFLLAFAHDPAGLNQPKQLDHYLELLRQRHPSSLFAELAGAVRSARPMPAMEIIPAKEPEPVATSPTTPNPTPVALTTNAPASVSAATNGVASAQQAKEPTPSTLSPETQMRVQFVLRKRDLNKDGSLNPVEFRLWLGPNANFKAADRNQDGKVDEVEIGWVLDQEKAAPQAE